ncbi:MAG: hypothetical protein D6731_19410 [Planctomycetota bacterium]|nr:MAG: hypothetical protein D6731_19410 [Planctomycetota bacterium]
MLTQGCLGWSDRDFLQGAGDVEEVREALEAADFVGVVLDGPREVPLDAEAWPVVACERCTESSGPAAEIERLGALVALDEDDGRAWIDHAFEVRVPDTSLRPDAARPAPEEDEEDEVEDPDDEVFEVSGDEGPEWLSDDLSPEELDALVAAEEPPLPPGATEEPVADLVYFLPHRLDLAARLGLPRRPARYAVYLVFLDQVAGPVRLRVGPPPGAYRDPEVEAFLARRREELPPPVVAPAPGEGARYGADADSAPQPPSDEGLVLAVEPRLRRGEPLWVRGAFRLPLPPQRRTLRADGKAFDVGAAGALGVVSVDLVFTGPVYGGPMRLRLEVPVFEEPDAAGRCAGRFAVEATRTGALHDVPAQPYSLHAFAAARHRASARFEVVEDEAR